MALFGSQGLRQYGPTPRTAEEARVALGIPDFRTGAMNPGGPSMFDPPPTYPDFAMSGEGMGPDIDLPANTAPARPSFFGEGGLGRHIAGSIGDMLLQRGGNSPIYGPTAQLRLRQRMEEVQAERQERMIRDRYAWQRQYDLANPRPTAPYRWEANDGSLMELGPDGQPRVAYKDPTPKINWIQVKDPQTGELRIIPMGPQGPMGGQQPQAVDVDGDDWEDVGGPSPGGSAGFP